MRNARHTDGRHDSPAAPPSVPYAPAPLALKPDPATLWSGCRRLLHWPPSPAEDIYNALFRFTGTLYLESEDIATEIAARPVLFLANHQTMVESPLFMMAATGLFGRLTSAVAHVLHRTSWVGWTLAHHLAYPGISDPKLMFLFDDQGQRDFMRNLAGLQCFLEQRRHSLLVHVDGGRAQTCRHRTSECSGVFLRLALALDLPIVPLRFRGGLPVHPVGALLDFPLGYTRQDYWLGRPIHPAELTALDPEERKELVLERLNRLGGPIDEEAPNAPDKAFVKAVEREKDRWRTTEAKAVLAAALAALPAPYPQTGLVLEALHSGRISAGNSAEERWLAKLATWLSDGGIRILA